MATLVWAGSPLTCGNFVSAPGSLFEDIIPLARKVLESDDRPGAKHAAYEFAAQLAAEADAKPRDLRAQVKAGYLRIALDQMWGVRNDTGGTYLRKAEALAPRDAEIQLLLGLAAADATIQNKHLEQARRWSADGSVVRKNLDAALKAKP